MAGITDRPFRLRAERFGAGLAVSEMIASAGLAAGQREMVRKLGRTEKLPHAIQLAGCEERWMRLGAQLAEEAGADIIDINFGCPSKRVTNGFAGSALMQVPDVALRLVEAVAGATSLPVTVKMRLGWDDENLNAPQIARLAVGAGAQMIAVHGRTRQQFYKGSARWDAVRSVVESVAVPVVVNGDITSFADAQEALRLSGAAGVMIGRGAQGQPWLVGQIGAALAGASGPAAPTAGALADFVAEHHADMLSEYGTELGMRVARKHIGWYLEANAPETPTALRREMLSTSEPGRLRQLIAVAFGVAMGAAA